MDVVRGAFLRTCIIARAPPNDSKLHLAGLASGSESRAARCPLHQLSCHPLAGDSRIKGFQDAKEVGESLSPRFTGPPGKQLISQNKGVRAVRGCLRGR